MKLTEGKPIIYIPVCKHPRDFMFTFGPLGYKRVEKLERCPLLVEKQTEKRKNDAPDS